MKRRKFINITTSASALAMLQAHSLLAFASIPQKNPAKKHLIASIKLQTTTPLSIMRKFYAETLSLRILVETEKVLTVEAGESVISFEYLAKVNYRPFYHFAFNIPENKIDQAFTWQRKRTPVVHPNPEFKPDQITHFTSWNAHSVFFLDPAGNLLEYIARHDLKNAAEGDFTPKDILYLSEIGFITEDVKATGEHLMKTLNMTEYRPGSSGFWPIGDELGLLLMIKKGNKWTSNPDQMNTTDVFKTEVKINTNEKNHWELKGHPYWISGEK